MSATAIAAPKFRKNQMVCFVGGSGMIRGYQSKTGTWTYFVEMEMGSVPKMGRVDYETTVLLPQAGLT